MPQRFRTVAAIALILVPALAGAQPSLESLWPNPDGLRWDYELSVVELDQPEFVTAAFMQLAGSIETPTGTAQALLAEHATPPAKAALPGLDPLLASVWRARPDLRAAIAARAATARPATDWWPLLLNPGAFSKGTSSIQMLRQDIALVAWTYLTDNLQPGAEFSLQLVPDLADNVFLFGTVEAVDASITTPAGDFTDAVRVRYRIDYGWADLVDEQSQVIGRFRSETRGHVHYVPDVGPVAMLEEFVPLVEVECYIAECDPFPGVGVGEVASTLTLTLQQLPVAVAARSWSEVKAAYRR
jgi:hypothetical protein